MKVKKIESMNDISIAGTLEIRDRRLLNQGSLLNSTVVIFHLVNEKMNETNSSAKLIV